MTTERGIFTFSPYTTAPKKIKSTNNNLTTLEQSAKSMAQLLRSGTDCPHLLIHGPRGCGKTTALRMALQSCFGNEMDMCSTYQIESDAIKIPTTLARTAHTLEMVVDCGIDGKDSSCMEIQREVVMKAMDLMAQSCKANGLIGAAERKVQFFIIRRFDRLFPETLAALRQSLETDADRRKVIGLVSSADWLPDAMRSRFFMVRVPAPKPSEYLPKDSRLLLHQEKILSITGDSYNAKRNPRYWLAIESNGSERSGWLELWTSSLDNIFAFRKGLTIGIVTLCLKRIFNLLSYGIDGETLMYAGFDHVIKESQGKVGIEQYKKWVMNVCKITRRTNIRIRACSDAFSSVFHVSYWFFAIADEWKSIAL